MKLLFLVLGLLTSHQGLSAEVEYVAVSSGGYKSTLKFDDKVTQRTEVGRLCSSADFELVEAKLWMDMGGNSHGSTPTKLRTLSNGCYEISKINFVMAGKWQIIMKFDNNDRAVFEFPVARY